MKNNKKILLTTIGIAILIIGLVGITYSFFNYTRTGTANSIRVGRIYFNSNQTDTINLSNVFPIDSEDIGIDTTNTDEVVITITGDTDYSNGVEYLLTASDVNLTLGTKKVPVSLEFSITGNNNNTLGILETGDYYNNRDNYAVSKYKIEYEDKIEEGTHLLVGYIAPNTTSGTIEGINGTITIKAYLDKDKILISDTYPEEDVDENNDGIVDYSNETLSTMAQGKVVFTTTEWNSMQNSPISFKVKVEANEGIWVNPVSTPLTYFNLIPVKSYTYNENRQEADIIECADYLESLNYDYLQEGETFEDFCAGTGTYDSLTMQEYYKGVWKYLPDLDELENIGIFISSPGAGIYDYDGEDETNIVIPERAPVYVYNENRSEDDIANCVEFMNTKYNGYYNNKYYDYCAGTGEIVTNDGIISKNFPDEFSFYEIKQLESINILKLSSDTYPVIYISDYLFSQKNITDLYISRNTIEIGYAAFRENSITNLFIPENVKIIDSYAFYENQLSRLIISNGVEKISSDAFSYNRLTEVAIPNSIKTIEDDAFGHNNISTLSIDMTNIPDRFSHIVNMCDLETVYIGDNVETIGKNAFVFDHLVNGTIVVPDSMYDSLTYNCDGEHKDTIADNGVLIINKSGTNSCTINALYTDLYH